MATKDDRPGLLSKVAMFVRNPTKDWSELDSIEQAPESGYDKQALKAMIERKRQNDFVRKREFDQLRKLRNRDPGAMAAQARPSFFQTSMPTDPDGRAVTLKKIDEIEAQMSKQWWKGKQESATGHGAGFPVAASASEGPATSATAQSTLTPTIPSESYVSARESDPADAQRASGTTEFAPTEMGSGMVPMASYGARAPVTAASMGAMAQSYDGSEVGFSTSKLFAIEVDDMATDPELEEAAIRFANGDDAGAEGSLLNALRADAILPDVALSWSAALLDLYRATGKRAQFDQAAQEFGARFEKITPVWLSLAEQPAGASLGGAVTPPVGTSAGPAHAAMWSSPPRLTVHAMENLREILSTQPMPWSLDWSRLEQIDADAMPLLGGLFGSLCDEPVSLRFSGADHLVQTLRSMTPSGERDIDLVWWAVRLNALRTLRLQDEFELAALDYCVTYEVAPPAWVEARCHCESVAGARGAAEPVAVAASFQAPTAPMGLDGGPATALELRGEVLGDATQALAGLEREYRSGDAIVVSCAGLVRVDFSAAGSILNWVAVRQSEGCHVQFRDVNRMVAAFFNVIGISEHARVVPRPL